MVSSTLIKQFNEENATPEQISKLRVRNAVRIVLLDETDQVAIIYSKKNNYYSLPGGGVEHRSGETLPEAAVRETKEETGCDSLIIKYLGVVEEVRMLDNLLNKSSGYISRIIGSKTSPALNEDELEENFELLWLNYVDAIKQVGTFSSELNLYHQYFLQRDLIFLNLAASEIK